MLHNALVYSGQGPALICKTDFIAFSCDGEILLVKRSWCQKRRFDSIDKPLRCFALVTADLIFGLAFMLNSLCLAVSDSNDAYELFAADKSFNCISVKGSANPPGVKTIHL